MVLNLEIVPDTLSENTPAAISPLSLPELLTGGEIAQATGVSVDADGTISLTGSGETVPQTPGTAIASRNISVSGERGGEINVLGDRVGVIAANLDAWGTNGGGKVLVGGDYQGEGTIPTADITYISPNSSLKEGNISATDVNTNSGDDGLGGTIDLTIKIVAGEIGDIDTSNGLLNRTSKGGDGGDVSLAVAEGGIDTSTIDSSSNGNGNFGGNISLTVENTKGAIDTTTGSLISGNGKGSAGDIDLSTDEGNIGTSNLTARSTASGTGGAVDLEVNRDFGDIDTFVGTIDSSSARNNGGNVSLTTAKGKITSLGLLWQPLPKLDLHLDYAVSLTELDEESNNLQNSGLNFSLSYGF